MIGGMDREKFVGENFMLWMIHLDDLGVEKSQGVPSSPRTIELEVLLKHTYCTCLSWWKKIWHLLGTMCIACKLHFAMTWESWGSHVGTLD